MYVTAPLWILLLTFLLTSCCPLLAQRRHQNPSRKSLLDGNRRPFDSRYHKLESGGKLTAYAITIPAHESTLIATHPHDYVLISLSRSNLEAVGSANRYPLQMEPEELQVIQGGWAHCLKNLGGAPASLIEIDVDSKIDPEHARCGLLASPCTDGRFGKTDEGVYTISTLFETATLKVTKVELGPGGSLPQHRHWGSPLLIPLTPIHLNDAAEEQVDKVVGEVHSYPAGITHELRNASPENVRLLEVEVK